MSSSSQVSFGSVSCGQYSRSVRMKAPGGARRHARDRSVRQHGRGHICAGRCRAAARRSRGDNELVCLAHPHSSQRTRDLDMAGCGFANVSNVPDAPHPEPLPIPRWIVHLDGVGTGCIGDGGFRPAISRQVTGTRLAISRQTWRLSVGRSNSDLRRGTCRYPCVADDK